MNDPGQQPIFFDETRRRWNIVSYFFVFAGLFAIVTGVAFAVQIVFSPQLPDISLTAARLGLAPSLLTERIKPLSPVERPITPVCAWHPAPGGSGSGRSAA